MFSPSRVCLCIGSLIHWILTRVTARQQSLVPETSSTSKRKRTSVANKDAGDEDDVDTREAGGMSITKYVLIVSELCRSKEEPEITGKSN